MQPSDELALRALIDRYADAVNLADAQAWRGTWAEEAEWHIGGREIAGRDAIGEFWLSAMAAFESVIQLVAQGRVWTVGDRAVGRWTVWEIGRKSAEGTFVIGCYEDRYVKEEQEWRFALRKFTATYRGAIPSGEFFAFPPLDASELQS